MSKISLVIIREYLTRVKKKSFIIISIIGPILFAGLMIAPAAIANLEDKEEKLIAVVDETYLFNDSIAQRDLIPDSLIKDSTHIFTHVIPDTQYDKFEFIEGKTVADLKNNFSESGYYAVLHIPSNITYGQKVQIFSIKQPPLTLQMHIGNSIEKELERLKLRAMGIDQNILKSVKTSISVSTIKWEEGGTEKETNQEIASIVGMISGVLIYMFIFMYGSQVMRGVIEEKTSRIVEVIVSSVRPFQLMMGKIIGIAMVSLTQIILWIIFTFIIVTASYSIFFNEKISTEQLQPQNIMENQMVGNQMADVSNAELESIINETWTSIGNIDFAVMILAFVFFFIGGYLLYASLFAAVGSAVDNEADTQQFMLPITVPLILAFIMMYSIINNPEGPIAFWGSMIPFTSPIVMMARIPFGVPYWQVGVSAGLLIITFIGTTWLAGKIYRTGILMYGKKISYKELWKWLKYKS
ncbi:MAG: ABC transporter permease [Bacteroidota bacterium]